MQLLLTNLVCYSNEIPLGAPLNLQLSFGEAVVLQGVNGAGKSTILRACAGVIHNFSGSIRRLVTSYYLSHELVLHENLTVSENLQALLALQDLDNSMSNDLLRKIGLYEKRAVYPWQLSKGQQQKLHLAPLLFNQAPLWLLDEPFVHLDAASMDFFAQLLQAHLQNGSMLISLHGVGPLANARILKIYE